MRISGLADELPDADVLVVPADDPPGDQLLQAPPGKGTAVLYLQGFGRQLAPDVRVNLRHASRVVALSRWLEDEARRAGCDVRHVAPGLDRAIFYSGPPVERRERVVSVMTHSKDWKGTDDALAALDAVRRALPDTQIILFGVSLPENVVAERVERPSRPAVADILRRSAVFVCSSWEEGLGMPGMEALACGTALATTDTKGSRDYAIDRQTALVTPPRDPAALAQSIIELLGDADLRARLADAGRRHVSQGFPEWPVAARRFEVALAELT
ncbi:MAG: glycosyltransferase family 4 protein [Solirubrobacteraceae bacterium]